MSQNAMDTHPSGDYRKSRDVFDTLPRERQARFLQRGKGQGKLNCYDDDFMQFSALLLIIKQTTLLILSRENDFVLEQHRTTYIKFHFSIVTKL